MAKDREGCPGAKEFSLFGVTWWRNAAAHECAREDREDRQGQRQEHRGERVETRQEEHSERVDTRQSERSERTDTRQSERSERLETRGKYGIQSPLGSLFGGLGAGLQSAACTLVGVGCPQEGSSSGSGDLTTPLLLVGGAVAVGGLLYVALKD